MLERGAALACQGGLKLALSRADRSTPASWKISTGHQPSLSAAIKKPPGEGRFFYAGFGLRILGLRTLVSLETTHR
jgi:hypothetical protein